MPESAATDPAAWDPAATSGPGSPDQPTNESNTLPDSPETEQQPVPAAPSDAKLFPESPASEDRALSLTAVVSMLFVAFCDLGVILTASYVALLVGGKLQLGKRAFGPPAWLVIPFRRYLENRPLRDGLEGATRVSNSTPNPPEDMQSTDRLQSAGFGDARGGSDPSRGVEREAVSVRPYTLGGKSRAPVPLQADRSEALLGEVRAMRRILDEHGEDRLEGLQSEVRTLGRILGEQREDKDEALLEHLRAMALTHAASLCG